MVDRTALKLLFEPDDYLCSWDIPDGSGNLVTTPGSINLIPNRPPSGVVYGQMPIQWKAAESTGDVHAAFPQRVVRPVIEATLANGGHLALIDATIEYWGTDTGRLSGAAALVTRGSGFRDISLPTAPVAPRADSLVQPIFSNIEFQVTGADAVSGFAPIAGVSNPFTTPKPAAYSVTLQEPMKVEWVKSGITMNMDYIGRLRIADAYEYQFAFSPVIRVETEFPLSLRQWIDDWVEPIRRVVCIATGRTEQLTYLSVRKTSGHNPPSARWQVFGRGLQQAPFDSSTDGVKGAQSTLRCRSDDVSLLDVTQAWQKFAVEHHPLTETYGSMVTVDVEHPRSRYLLLVQALEGLYGYENRAVIDTQNADYGAQRAVVLKRIEDRVDSKDLRFLKNRLPKRLPSSLDDALRSLVSTLPVDRSGDIAANHLVAEIVQHDDRANGQWAGALRVIRNDLAHGNKGYDAQELDGLVEVLEQVVRAHCLRVLGCPNRVVERALTTDPR